MTETTRELQMGTSYGRAAPEGYALWEFTGETWKLKKDASLEGARPSSPPSIPGTFSGQIRATPSVAVSS